MDKSKGCTPPPGHPWLMLVAVLIFFVTPVTLASAVSSPPITGWTFLPGAMLGAVLVGAYYRWWRGERRHD